MNERKLRELRGLKTRLDTIKSDLDNIATEFDGEWPIRDMIMNTSHNCHAAGMMIKTRILAAEAKESKPKSRRELSLAAEQEQQSKETREQTNARHCKILDMMKKAGTPTVDMDYHQFDERRRSHLCAFKTRDALRAAGFFVWSHMGINRDRIVTNATVDQIRKHEVKK